MSGDADRYVEALRLAAIVHDGQHWKGTREPYLTHVVRVARALAQDGQPRLPAETQAGPLVLAGLLHDTLEDLQDSADIRARLAAICPGIRQAADGQAALVEAVAACIADRFGSEVRQLVEAVTARAADDESDTARRARRARQVAHLRDAPHQVVLLKAADTRANVEAMAAALDTPTLAASLRAHAPVDDLASYYGDIVEVVMARLIDDHPMVRALADAYAQLRRVIAAAGRS